MNAMNQARLLADIGGTHARLARQEAPGAPVGDVVTLACADYASVGDALRAGLRQWNRPMPRLCGLAIANPVQGDRVRMTNHHWEFSISQLRAEFGFERLKVLNDFSALARAVPALPAQDLRRIGGGQPQTGAPLAVIGPGTGLGVSGLLPDGRGGWTALEGEGGHATLAACSVREHQVLAQLALGHGHVSAERALSGQGLVNLHGALWAMAHRHEARPALNAAEITAGALAREDPICHEAVQLFCAFLGTAAGNLALTLGARGGVYLGGGIVPRLGCFIDASRFRERFEAKGRLSPYLAGIPVFAIHAPQSPALMGMASALDEAC